MTTMKQFVNRYNVRIESEMVGENPNFIDDKFQGYHYKCVLRCKGRQMTTYFSMGYGLDREPTARDVLSCLASDSSSIENSNFEEWASELGYDTDSRKAHKTYNICVKQAEKLKKFLGPNLYKQLLWETEPE